MALITAVIGAAADAIGRKALDTAGKEISRS